MNEINDNLRLIKLNIKKIINNYEPIIIEKKKLFFKFFCQWGLGPIPNPQSPIPNPHKTFCLFICF